MRTSFLNDVHLILSGFGFPRSVSDPGEHSESTLLHVRLSAESPDKSCFESLMSDPMTHLVMLRDNVTESEVRGVISRARARRSLENFCEKNKTAALQISLQGERIGRGSASITRTAVDRRAIEDGENEGMALA